MSLTKTQKSAQLKELKDKMQSSQSVVFANYIGLKVTEVSDLRRKLKSSGAEMKVAKKTLIRMAMQQKGLPVPTENSLPGPVACIFSISDPIVGPQVAFAFSKDHPQVSFVGGFFEKKLLAKEEAMTLATIPSRRALLATFADILQSPMRSLVSIVNSPLTGFVRALSEKAKQQSA